MIRTDLFLGLLLLLILPLELLGAEFDKKQTGTTTIANGNTTATVAITGVDMSKSFLVFSTTITNNDPNNYQIGGEITNSTTLTFRRTGTTGTVDVSWQVFEFESGVYVQHGSETNVARNSAVDVGINCIDLTKSFALISGRKSGTTMGNDDGITANLTSATNLQLFITGGGGANMEEAYWQVIEYQGAVVKKLVTSLNAGSTSTTSTISPAITDLSKAFVISNHGNSGNMNVDDLPRTELTNTTTVTYTRVGTAQTANFVTYVVEFTDASTVTRGVQNFASGVSVHNVTISATTASGVFGSGNYGRQGSADFATNDNTGHSWFTYEISSPTNLIVSRSVNSSIANLPWQIVTFEDNDIQQNTFYSLATGDWESNSSWSWTPDGSSGAVPVGVYPERANDVVIQNGHTITIDDVMDNDNCSSQSPDGLGRSDVGTFTGSGDQMFYHTGDIIIADGGTMISTEETMLEGYTLIEDGGTFTMSEDIVILGYFEVSASATFTNTDDLILSGTSTTIMNNTSTGADDIYMDHTSATLCGTGIMNLGNGGADPEVQYLNGATSAQICSTFTITCTSNCGGFTTGPPSGSFITGNIGPGGVGDETNNELWLRADQLNLSNSDPVTSWNDVSGNGLVAAASGTPGEEPTFVTNSLNSVLPSLSFDGNDYLNLGTPASLNFIPGTDSWSFYIIYNVPALAQGTFFSKATSTTATRQYQYTIDDSGGTSRFTSYIGGNGVVGSITSEAAWFTSSHTNNTTNRDSWTDGGDNFASPGIGTGQIPAAEVLVGARRAGGPTTGTGFLLTGSMAEIAMYNVESTLAQRIIIENYLAAKSDIALTANDVYDMDDNANGDYDFDLAGIGQASDGSNHRDAIGQGIVRMWNPNDLDNSEFLLWAHDNTILASANNVDVDGAIIEERLSRIWRVSETGDVGTVSISFDFNGVGNPLGSNLRLLIDRDGDGFADNDVTPIVGVVSANIATFSGVDFQDGDRFTLGNTDASIPLPIELVEFKVYSRESKVDILWTTGRELNNDYFTIQRSKDALEWINVGNVPGAGNSEEELKYSFVDDSPFSGRSYYRLKQTDYDGNTSYSKIRSSWIEPSQYLDVYPNPSNDIFTISTNSDLDIGEMLVFSSLGKVMNVSIYYDGGLVKIDAKNLSSGVYILRIPSDKSTSSIRLVKQ